MEAMATIAPAPDFQWQRRAAPVNTCMTSMSKPFELGVVSGEAAGIGDEDIEAAQHLGAIGDPGLQCLRSATSNARANTLPWLRCSRFHDLVGVARADGNRALGDEALGDGEPMPRSIP
jgi:hypothetical protein